MNVVGIEIDEPFSAFIRKDNLELIDNFPLTIFSEGKRSFIDKSGNGGFYFVLHNILKLIKRYIIRIVINHLRTDINRLEVEFLPIVVDGSDISTGLF